MKIYFEKLFLQNYEVHAQFLEKVLLCWKFGVRNIPQKFRKIILRELFRNNFVSDGTKPDRKVIFKE